MRQVLQNLLDNAVKYTDAGGVGFSAALDPTAPVGADTDTRVLLFTVTDTGRGIAPADRERLFAPFEQVQHTASGSGLGLAICRELAAVLAVDTAEDAEAALAIARSRPPDLVMADLRMPGTCGYAAVWQLREALGRPRLPAIAASASPLPEPGDATALGFAVFLLKPIEQGPLRTALGACLGLTWLRGDTASTHAPPAPDGEAAPGQASLDPTAEPPLRPPPIELDAARELAEQHDWASLREWCAEIGDAFPECADFAQHLGGPLYETGAGADAAGVAGALQRLLVDPG